MSLTIVGALAPGTSLAYESNTFAPGNIAKGAPQELNDWAKMVGQWSTTEEGLKSDAGDWQPSKGADWDFFWAFNGWGIQDNYTLPPLSQKLDDESKRQRITFFDVEKSSFEWKLEWSQDQESWLDVYRIHALKSLSSFCLRSLC